jgi:hypothetical protein
LKIKNINQATYYIYYFHGLDLGEVIFFRLADQALAKSSQTFKSLFSCQAARPQPIWRSIAMVRNRLERA